MGIKGSKRAIHLKKYKASNAVLRKWFGMCEKGLNVSINQDLKRSQFINSTQFPEKIREFFYQNIL